MRSIRVLMVVRLFYPWVGGTELQAQKLAKKLREKGISVEIVTGWWFRGTLQEEVVDTIPVYRNHTLWEFFGIKGMRKFGGYLYILTLLWTLWRRRNSYDLIHIHGLNYHTFAAVLAGRWFHRKTLTKLANSGRASDINKMRKNEQLALAQYMLPTALKSDQFVALNRTVVQELEAVGVPQQNIVELANGVETDQIEAKSSYTLHSPANLVFVGRLHKQKGLDILLKAFQRLLQSHPQDGLNLSLIGDGPLREDLVRLAGQLAIDQYVNFIGESDKVNDHLQEADIFVLPSRAEGLSNALLEAMACGLPAVVSDVPGNVDIVEHDKNGLLANVDDPNALASALAALLNDTALRSRIGSAARQIVESQYSLNTVAESYIKTYEELLSQEEESQWIKTGKSEYYEQG